MLKSLITYTKYQLQVYYRALNEKLKKISLISKMERTISFKIAEGSPYLGNTLQTAINIVYLYLKIVNVEKSKQIKHGSLNSNSNPIKYKQIRLANI